MVSFEDKSISTNAAGLKGKDNLVAPEITVIEKDQGSTLFGLASLEVGGKRQYADSALSRGAEGEIPPLQPASRDLYEVTANAGIINFSRSVLIFDAPIHDQHTLVVDEHVPISRESKIALTNMLNNLPRGNFHIAIYSPDSDNGAALVAKVEKELELHLQKSGDQIEVRQDGAIKTALPIYRYVGNESCNQEVGVFVVGERASEKGSHQGINRNIAADSDIFTQAREVGVILKVGTSVGPAQQIHELNERFSSIDPATGFARSTEFEHHSSATTKAGLSIGARFFVEASGATLAAELNHDFALKLTQLSVGLDFPISYNYIVGPISLGVRGNIGIQSGVTEIRREVFSSSDPTPMPEERLKKQSSALGGSGVLSAPDMLGKGLGLQGEVGVNWNDWREAQPFARLSLTKVLPL